MGRRGGGPRSGFCCLVVTPEPSRLLSPCLALPGLACLTD